DTVTVTMPYAEFEYSVERTEIVEPTATEVIDPVSFDRLVLSACHPLYSAAQRIVVFAKLERVTPTGPALL
ncbi:MAG: sortase, partial [Solirubrobacteraceae bacterium]